VSIFGNSGDGKSHTLNHIFFNGEETFKTSSDQRSCTLGITCSYQRYFYNTPVLCLDTEGFHGVAQNENKQHRMLMKVLAISDIIIYRSRAERLSSDMYKFLATASKIYQKHLSPLLQNDEHQKNNGPSVIIFHEVQNTMPLDSTNLLEAPEAIIKEKFTEMKLNIDAFNSLKYVGTKTNSTPTDFNKLRSILKSELESKLKPMRSIRSIYEQLDLLNKKFANNLDFDIDKIYTHHCEAFMCDVECEACFQRCENTRDHVRDGTEHSNSSACLYQQSLNNKIYLCKKCHFEGRRSIVKVSNSNGDWISKYAWSSFGSKIECQRHGEIYKARWYGNKSPEEICVLSEAVHCWRDGMSKNQVPIHSAQAIIDGFSYISEAITSVSAQPSKSVSSWVADNLVNPEYWQKNSEILNCNLCKTCFEKNGLKIHHCRNCGCGVCNDCSRNRMAVPLHLGWGHDIVRVCNKCRDELMKNESSK
jgi:zinc finger FYVE domain-containing protein 1